MACASATACPNRVVKINGCRAHAPALALALPQVWDGEESELAQVHNALGFCYFNMEKVGGCTS